MKHPVIKPLPRDLPPIPVKEGKPTPKKPCAACIKIRQGIKQILRMK
jgi:hypothetical protein